MGIFLVSLIGQYSQVLPVHNNELHSCSSALIGAQDLSAFLNAEADSFQYGVTRSHFW